MTEKDIATLLIRNGIAKQKSQPDEYTEANEDAVVKSLGNAAIANSLEFLGKHGIVADVQPTFSHRGLGFAYRISQQLVEELSNDELISHRIEALFEEPASETSATVVELLKNAKRRISMLCIGMIYSRTPGKSHHSLYEVIESMKRTFTLILFLLAIVSLTACSRASDSTTKSEIEVGSKVPSESQSAEATSSSSTPEPSPSPSSVPLPSPSKSPTPETILHVDNVKKIPVANRQEDFYEIEDAIGIDDDAKALSMIQKGKGLMVENDSLVLTLEPFGYLTKIKVKKTGQVGWTKSSWILPKQASPELNQAMLLAARDGQVEKVKSLLDRGADINAQNSDNGDTALMYAADGGYVETVKLLIARGANLNLKDQFGYTALSGLGDGINDEQKAVIRILKRVGAK